MTITINTSEAKETFIELVNKVILQGERVILTRRGKPVAAIVTMQALESIEQVENKQFLSEATDALKEAREVGCVTLEELMLEMRES